MAKIHAVDFRTKEQKRADRKYAIKRKVDDACQWIRMNKDVIILATPIVCTVIGGTTKVASKMIQQHNLNKEIDFKQRTIYDHSLGRYVELRRPLTAAQALTIEERRAQGEKLHTILDSMGLLKR